jgi:hypothetical protein
VRVDASHGGVVEPVLLIEVEVDVDEAVAQRRGHGVDHAAVALAVAGSDDVPVLRERVVADAEVEDELVRRSADGRRRGVHLIKEEDAGRIAVRGQEVGWEPLHAPTLRVGHREAADVDLAELRETNVADLELLLCAELMDD